MVDVFFGLEGNTYYEVASTLKLKKKIWTKRNATEAMAADLPPVR